MPKFMIFHVLPEQHIIPYCGSGEHRAQERAFSGGNVTRLRKICGFAYLWLYGYSRTDPHSVIIVNEGRNRFFFLHKPKVYFSLLLHLQN